MASGTIKTDNWTLVGTSSSDTQNVTYPSTAKELYFVLKINLNGTMWALPNSVFVDSITDAEIIVVNGYDFDGNSARGFVFANHNGTNRTVNLRNYRVGAVTTGGTLYVYYR